MSDTYENLPPLERLKAIMARLRSPGGCNWDRSQTHKSLLPYLIEEAYEVVEAIEDDDKTTLKEELGDLLIQIFFHAQIADEDGLFDINDIAHDINEKLVRRHPHVFDERKDLNPEQVRDQWEKIKVETKEKESVLGGVPKSMPALNLAFRVGEKAAGVGFDWRRAEEIFDKIREEQSEFEAEFDKMDKQAMENELGDMIFAQVNLARKVGIDPEMALRRTVMRFVKRFGYIEASLKTAGKPFSDTSLEEMEELWQESKRII